MKHYEKLSDGSEISPTERKEAEDQITGLKRELQSVAAEEQQRQAASMEAEEQLCIEQAKLNDLEDRVDRLEKALDNNPHQALADPCAGTPVLGVALGGLPSRK